MTIQLRAVTDALGAGTSITIDKPTGTVEGDLIVISIGSDTKPESGVAITGFTEHVNYANTGDNHSGLIFYKVAGAAEPATYTVTGMVTTSLAVAETFYDTVGGSTWGLSTPVSASGLLTVNAGPISVEATSLLHMLASNDAATTITVAPTGMTAGGRFTGSSGMILDNYYQNYTPSDGAVSKSVTYAADNAIGILTNITYAAVFTQSVTVSNIVDGESLTGLYYRVFDSQDLRTMAPLLGGSGEITDGSGNLVIDLSSVTVSDAQPLTIIIGDWATTPTITSKGAICYANAVVA